MKLRMMFLACMLTLTTLTFAAPPAAADPNGCTGANPPSPTFCGFHCHFGTITVTYTITLGTGPGTVTATCDGVRVASCTATLANPTCTAVGFWAGRDPAFGLCTGTTGGVTFGTYKCSSP